jgi:DNA-binding winged helix-turn-helix (wHTH) protein
VRYQFDAFTIDGATRRLLRGEREIHLSPKAFDLLVLLVENSSQAVAKEQLHEKLWPSTFVSETNLAGLIVELRQALDDSAGNSRYIRTVHRFGYWFVGDVRQEVRDQPPRPPVRYWLLWDTRQIALHEGENLIGRARDAEVWIDATGVSRRHARIRLEHGDATVEDLGSKNGTYLHGKRIAAPTLLTDGDQIRIGSVLMTFRIPPPADSTQTVCG